MEGCFFCQGPLDAATGRCQQCGRVQPAQGTGASSDTPDSISARSIRCPACGEDMPVWASACWRCGGQLHLSSEQVEVPQVYEADDLLTGPAEDGQIQGQVFSAYLTGDPGMAPTCSGGANAITEQENVTPLPPRSISRRRVLLGLAGLAVAGGGALGLGMSSILRLLNFLPTLVIFQGDDNYVRCVAWSPDGKRLASGGFGGIVHIWDSATGQRLLDYPSDGQYHTTLTGIAWSPDGARVASSNFIQPVQVWEATTGQMLTTYGDPAYPPFAFAWSPDWQRIALAQIDAVQVLDSHTLEILAVYRGQTDPAGYPEPAAYLSWSPDGAHIASVGLPESPIIHVWEAATGNPVTIYHGHETTEDNYDFEGLAWSPDGKRIVSVALFSGIQVWDVMSGALLLKYHGHDSGGGTFAVAWSPDGTRIASGGEDQTVQIWEATSGQTLLVYNNTVTPTALAWSPDGKRIASVASKTVRVWQPV